jgi:hypothetical protein
MNQFRITTTPWEQHQLKKHHFCAGLASGLAIGCAVLLILLCALR